MIDGCCYDSILHHKGDNSSLFGLINIFQIIDKKIPALSRGEGRVLLNRLFIQIVSFSFFSVARCLLRRRPSKPYPGCAARFAGQPAGQRPSPG